jgi:hypothetical protein
VASSTHKLVIVAEMKRTLLDENLPPANRLRIVEALDIAQRFGGLAPEMIALERRREGHLRRCGTARLRRHARAAPKHRRA